MDEAQVQELAARFEQDQQRLQALDRHLAYLEQALAEIRQAMTTLEGLEGHDKTASLVPLGAGLRIHAKVDPSALVMLDVGGGYTIETDAETARGRLKARLESTEAAMRSTSTEADRVAESMQQVRMQLAEAQADDDAS